jgi:hypothetical protein
MAIARSTGDSSVLSGPATSANDESPSMGDSTTGRPNVAANARSRSSWAGTAMMAPVP